MQENVDFRNSISFILYLQSVTESNDGVFSRRVNRGQCKCVRNSNDGSDVYENSTFATFVFAHVIQSQKGSTNETRLKEGTFVFFIFQSSREKHRDRRKLTTLMSIIFSIRDSSKMPALLINMSITSKVEMTFFTASTKVDERLFVVFFYCTYLGLKRQFALILLI